MDRWVFKTDDYRVIATPDIEKMNEHIKQAVGALTESLTRQEERWILESSPHETLVRLRDLCGEILERRKVDHPQSS